MKKALGMAPRRRFPSGNIDGKAFDAGANFAVFPIGCTDRGDGNVMSERKILVGQAIDRFAQPAERAKRIAPGIPR